MLWNNGQSIIARSAFLPGNVWSLQFYLQREVIFRDLAMFDLAIDTKLRGCDLVELRIGEVVADGEMKKLLPVTEAEG